MFVCVFGYVWLFDDSSGYLLLVWLFGDCLFLFCLYGWYLFWIACSWWFLVCACKLPVCCLIGVCLRVVFCYYGIDWRAVAIVCCL